MDWKNGLQLVVDLIPTVQNPQGRVAFKQKAKWTVAIVALYFIMTNIPLYGLSPGGSDLFGQFRSILAGQQGSILQLGIGPIVTASIVLQIMKGTDLLPLDLSNPRDQNIYQGLRRMLIIVMCVVNAAPIVYAGNFLPASQQTASALGIGLGGVQTLMFIQVLFGGIFIYYMDEVISKWGLGSGIGLFIVAGVSQQLIGGVFAELIPGWWNIVSGQVELTFSADTVQFLLFGSGQIVAILTTVIIFAIIVYAESTRVEIPVSNHRVTGAQGNFPVKLIYASVLPIILVRAVQANIQFIGQLLTSQLGTSAPGILGSYNSQGQPISGLFYYLNPIQSPEQWMWWLGSATADPSAILIRLLFDFSWTVIGGAIFAVFWVRSTGMDAEATADKIYNSGLEIPGFRRHPQKIERVLERYIPYITVIGGALIGFLAVVSNMLGTLGGVTGTGLLLAVSITYKLYEEIGEELEKEMYPRLQEFMGKN